MSASLPDASRLASIIRQVLEGSLSREGAAQWATSEIARIEDLELGGGDRIDPDDVRWELMLSLTGVDMLDDDDSHYLHGLQDVRSWLQKLRASGIEHSTEDR